jgi:uncharacterized protein YdaU (DUF1376 family)
MSAALPWMAMDFAELATETEGFTLEQVGAYVRIMAKCWQIGGWIASADSNLAAVCGVTKTHWLRHIAPAVRGLFSDLGEGKMTHQRVQSERGRAIRFSESRAKNARKTAEKPAKIEEKTSENIPPVFNENNALSSASAEQVPVHRDREIEEREERKNVRGEIEKVHIQTPESVPAPEVAEPPPPKRRLLDLNSPEREWIALGRSIDPNCYIGNGTIEWEPFRQDCYLGPDGDRRAFYGVCRKVVGVARQTETWKTDFSVVGHWLQKGWDVKDEIIPTIREVRKSPTFPKVIHSLNIFSRHIEAVHERNVQKKAAYDASPVGKLLKQMLADREAREIEQAEA